MNIIIRTQYRTNANGASQILAKGGGKQRTVGYRPEWSSDRNHGYAAGVLAEVLGLSWGDNITHDQTYDGCRHFFSWK